MKYRRNELFLTTRETITVVRSPNSGNQLLHSFIDGLVEAKIFLSDYPHLELQINDYTLSSSFSSSLISPLPHPLTSNTFFPVDDEVAVSFHSSCSIHSTSPFLLHVNTLYFHDPNHLMSYRVTQYPNYLDSLLACQVILTSSTSYEIKIQSLHLSLQNVTLFIPLLADKAITRIMSKPGNGSARWCPEKDQIEWSIASMICQRQYSISVIFNHNGSVSLSPTACPLKKCILSPINAQFCVLHKLVSNRMKIEKLKLLRVAPDYQWRLSPQFHTETKEYHVPVEYRSDIFRSAVHDPVPSS
jgi:hypothetical protein